MATPSGLTFDHDTRPLLYGTTSPMPSPALHTNFAAELRRLELSEYLEALVAEGFDTWEMVLDITESDLNSLNVKIGHRRKLQRAIAESRGHCHNYLLPIALSKDTSTDGSSRNNNFCPDRKGKQGAKSAPRTAGSSTRRKYRRHPKLDENAPERSPTAYVIFSNYVKESLKSHNLTFAETAKFVGGRWQVLPAEARETYQHQANVGKEKFYAKMAEYKKSPKYDAYQKYLEEFKTKHTPSRKDVTLEDKLFKSETQTSTSTRSSTHEYGDRSSNSIVSSL